MEMASGVDEDRGAIAPGGIAILVYDFRGSGVVRNALRIAGAASAAGLDVRLWPIRKQGELTGSVPAGVKVEPIHAGTRTGSRDLDSLASVPALARALVYVVYLVRSFRGKVAPGAGGHGY